MEDTKGPKDPKGLKDHKDTKDSQDAKDVRPSRNSRNTAASHKKSRFKGSDQAPPKRNSSSDDTADMPPPGKPRPNTPKREVDLSALLSFEEKVELVKLVNKVIDGMQQHINRLFESASPTDTRRVSYWDGLPAHLKDVGIMSPAKEVYKKPDVKPDVKPLPNQKENVKPSGTKPAMSTADQLAIAKLAISTDGNSTKDDSEPGPRMAELKKDVIVHFKRWQTGVQKRMSDISVKRSNDAQTTQSALSGAKKGSSPNKAKGPVPAPKIQIQQAVENDQLLTQLYPPTQTTLGSLALEKRNLLLHSLLLLLLSLEHYSSYSRILLLNIVSSLNLPLRMLTEDEVRVAKALAQVVKDVQQGDLSHKRKTADDGKSSKKWKNMADSGALVGPLVAASIGQVMGGGLGTSTTASVLGPLANNKLAMAAFFGLGRTVGKGMEQYAKDIPDLAFVPLHGSLGNQSEICKINPENRRFRVVFCINGWVNNEKPAGVSGATSPWKALEDHNEVHMLRWELETLGKIGNALEVVMKSTAWSKAKKEIIARTIFASLHQAIWPAGLLNVCKVIDNPWCIGLSRADKTGSVLADIIINKGQGERGVTLVGYSLGARVIFTCLMVLAERRAFGLVENAVLMGAPMPSDEFSWCAMKSVVSGRLINVFSENDHLLGFMYRMSSLHAGVAGLQRIQGVDGVENVDASANVSTHWRYQYMVGSILKHIGWENIDHAQVAKDEEVLAMVDRENVERERNHDADLAKKSGYGAENEVQQEPIPTRKRKNKNKTKNKTKNKK